VEARRYTRSLYIWLSSSALLSNGHKTYTFDFDLRFAKEQDPDYKRLDVQYSHIFSLRFSLFPPVYQDVMFSKATQIVTQGDFGVFDLPASSLTSQLNVSFVGLPNSCCSKRMATRNEATTWVYNNLASMV
jgi:hypothetical protein